MDASLPLHDRLMIAVHLLMCKYCSRFKQQLLILRKAVRFENLPAGAGGRPDVLANAARERIKKAVSEMLP